MWARSMRGSSPCIKKTPTRDSSILWSCWVAWMKTSSTPDAFSIRRLRWSHRSEWTLFHATQTTLVVPASAWCTQKLNVKSWIFTKTWGRPGYCYLLALLPKMLCSRFCVYSAWSNCVTEWRSWKRSTATSTTWSALRASPASTGATWWMKSW